MKPKKKPTSFSITPEAKTMLHRLAKRKGLSRTALVELLIRQEAKRVDADYQLVSGIERGIAA